MRELAGGLSSFYQKPTASIVKLLHASPTCSEFIRELLFASIFSREDSRRAPGGSTIRQSPDTRAGNIAIPGVSEGFELTLKP